MLKEEQMDLSPQDRADAAWEEIRLVLDKYGLDMDAQFTIDGTGIKTAFVLRVPKENDDTIFEEGAP